MIIKRQLLVVQPSAKCYTRANPRKKAIEQMHNFHTQQTEIISINEQHPDMMLLERAATLIRQGELVVFPTETVYGLGADAFQPQAVERIFTVKGRPLSDPLIVHIADEADLNDLVTAISIEALQLIRAFWPGPLTLILPATSRVPKLITAGLPNVAVRMPRHPIAQALIRAAGTPIAAPSANRFMHVSPTTAQHVEADLGGRIPLILDGGPCTVGVESTVLDLCAPVPTILRPGGVSLEALKAVLPTVQIAAKTQDRAEQVDREALQSPGQMLIHYSPTVPAYLYAGTEEAMRQAMLAAIQRYQSEGARVGILIADEDMPAFIDSGAQIYILGQTLEQIAMRLFAGLRTLEEAGVEVILCRSFAEEGLGLAIADRLRKATGGKVIDA
jgi:L-threonylcarbamoyladenylate synthase